MPQLHDEQHRQHAERVRQQQGLVGSAVVVQYFLSPSLTIQGSASSQGESAIDAFWHKRFGGGPRPTPRPSVAPTPVPTTPTPVSSPRADGISVTGRGAASPGR